MKYLALALSLALVACGSPRAADDTIKPYPLDTCLVMEAPLGSMGDPVVKVYGDQEVKFCCQACVAEFEANKDVYLAKLEGAAKD
jgi:hypothetical protein